MGDGGLTRGTDGAKLSGMKPILRATSIAFLSLTSYTAAHAQYPFAVGETLRYEASLGMLPAGSATITVRGTATDRGDDVFVFAMTGAGGPRGLRSSYAMTSWTGVDEFTSRRFHRRSTFGGRTTDERYRIVPDSLRYRLEGGADAWVAPREALDELAMLYYLRTLPLKPGDSYVLQRYFRNGYNPVRVDVTGREMIELGSGRTVRCIALRIAAAGITTELWITDDASRRPAQLMLPLPVGRVRLVLSQ